MDVTIVDRVYPFHEPSGKALNDTTNKAKGANCAIHDTSLKLFVITEREQNFATDPQ